MILDLVVIIVGFSLVSTLLAMMKESTTLFAINTGLFFILMVIVRIIELPYAFITSTNAITTGSFVFADVSGSIIMFVFALLNFLMYVLFRIQHSKEELQQKQKANG